MNLPEYIEAVTGQMRCKRAREVVAKELSDHVEDQKQAYIEGGMEAECAEMEAVRQMGDAVEVGTLMDGIHRPKLDKKILVIVGIFSIVSCFVQDLMIRKAHWVFEGGVDKILPVIVGLLVMTAVLFLDYTLLGKEPIKVWLAVMIVFPIVVNFEITAGNYSFGLGGHSDIWNKLLRLILFGLMLPLYAGVIYHYREKRWKGLFLCVLWLGAAGYIWLLVFQRIFWLFMSCLGCLILLTMAIAKGWFHIPKLPSLLALWLTITGAFGGIIFYSMQFGPTYQVMRLRAFFFGAEAGGENFITMNMRKMLGNLQFFGRSGYYVPEAPNFPWESATSFLMIGQEWGIFAMILVAAGFAILFGAMAAGISKQKNILGSLVGSASLIALFIPTLCHILNNFTLMPYADTYIPFLYPGYIVNVGCYLLLGLYLSVYRNTDVVA